jgi:hypothetical protein
MCLTLMRWAMNFLPPLGAFVVGPAVVNLAAAAAHIRKLSSSRCSSSPDTCVAGVQPSAFSSAVVFAVSRLIVPIVSESGRPPFFCHSFSWALLQANSCVLQLRVFCFPGSALTPLGSLP